MTTPYIRLTTDVLTDPKILKVGEEAMGVWVKGLLYSKLHLTDGFLPSACIQLVASSTRTRRQVVARLVSAGLWQEVEGGWTVGAEKWARYQTTREEVEAFRQANREKVKRFRQRQRNQCNADVTGYTQLGVTDTQSQSQRKEEDLQSATKTADCVPGEAAVVSSEKKNVSCKRDGGAAANGKATAALVWNSYSAAYLEKYGTAPTRNARVNGQIAQFTARVPHAEAPDIAAWYVRHPGAWYAQQGHSVGMLLRDAEKIRTEWQTGRTITATAARREERTAANPFLELIQEERLKAAKEAK